MKFHVLPSHSFTTNQWSGGTTTELFIYPKESSYQERDFLFRLSTATVEVEESTFTSLPGVYRKLMILDGKITINHQDHYKKSLNTFDTDAFEGSWKTTSVGHCKDFNLMLKENTKGDILHISVPGGETTLQALKCISNMVFVYAAKGICHINVQDKTIDLNVGDLVIMEELSSENLIFSSETGSDLVLVEVHLDN